MNQTQQPETPSVLALLRALVPKRPLAADEALRVAELQANRLREHFAILTPAAPNELVTELPRVRVDREPGLPVSGSAHWNGHYWVITLSAEEHPLRQRFSLFHEAKHVIDHTTKGFLYADGSRSDSHGQAERAADYFAACVLMPKRVVKRLWCEGPQDLPALARRLRVSPAALRYRLDQLGLLERAPRCAAPPRSVFRSARYFRARPALLRMDAV